MDVHTLHVEAAIDYIESHLDGKIDLETVADAVYYSKYHLHRIFTETVGMTMHDYVVRRQLTEAARHLVFSDRPVIEIAFICGYESQQAFSAAFKAMFKIPPAEYRDTQEFYPLQLRFVLHDKVGKQTFTKNNICLAEAADIPEWLDLMRLVIDGYPMMKETVFLNEIAKCIEEKRARVLRDGDLLVGAMAFCSQSGCIEFLGIHPQYRRLGIEKLFLDVLMDDCLPGREISMTTYRAGDKADTGQRNTLKQLGFAERELLVEFGYPTQRFALPGRESEDVQK